MFLIFTAVNELFVSWPLNIFGFDLAVRILKVTWKLNSAEHDGLGEGESVCREVDFVIWSFYLQFWPRSNAKYPGDKDDAPRQLFLELVVWPECLEELQVKVLLSYGDQKLEERTLRNHDGKGDGQSFYNRSEIKGQDIVFVVEVVKVNEHAMTDAEIFKVLGAEVSRLRASSSEATALADERMTAKRAAEAQAQKLSEELVKEKARQQKAEAEASHLRALISETNDRAAERDSHLTVSAVKIQAKWRQVLTWRRVQHKRAHRDHSRKQAKCVDAITCLQCRWRLKQGRHWVQREHAETERRLKQAKLVAAIKSLQCLWRLKQKKCELRWLRAQQGCSEAETPYDAILVFLA